MPRIWASSRRPGGLALGQLDHRRVAQDRADRPVLARGGALAPGGELARDRALARVEPADARQPPPDLLGVALVGRLGDRAALLARPLEPAALDQPLLDARRPAASRCSTSSRA